MKQSFIKFCVAAVVAMFTVGNAFAQDTPPNDEIWYEASSRLLQTTLENDPGLSTNAFNTSIISHSFFNGKGTIKFKGTVTSLGKCAFYRCTSLTSITIPNSVTSIGVFAFFDCCSLASVTIPNSVTSIGNYAFSGCSSLTSITIPNSVTSIGENAFNGCSSLPVIDNIRYADAYLIEAVDKSLSTYNIKEGTKWVGNSAFNSCKSLTSITIPNSVTSIGEYAFKNCSSLASVIIGNSVTNINKYAFGWCSSLASVTIPNSVMSIGECTFYNCSSLSSITIPNSVTSIGREAFYYCSSLSSITIPNSVTSIGDWAFYGCSGLTYITVGKSVSSIGSQAFQKCPALEKVYVTWSKPIDVCKDIFDYNSSGKILISLFVPIGKTAVYSAAAVWKDFYDIQEYEPKEAPITAISFANSEKHLTASYGYQLKPNITPADHTSVLTWSSSNPQVASVNNGNITTYKEGETTITVTSDNSVKASCKIVVKNPAEGQSKSEITAKVAQMSNQVNRTLNKVNK